MLTPAPVTLLTVEAGRLYSMKDACRALSIGYAALRARVARGEIRLSDAGRRISGAELIRVGGQAIAEARIDARPRPMGKSAQYKADLAAARALV